MRAALAIEARRYKAGQRARFIAQLIDEEDKPIAGRVPVFMVDDKAWPVHPPIPPTNREFGSTQFWFPMIKGNHGYSVVFATECADTGEMLDKVVSNQIVESAD